MVNHTPLREASRRTLPRTGLILRGVTQCRCLQAEEKTEWRVWGAYPEAKEQYVR